MLPDRYETSRTRGNKSAEPKRGLLVGERHGIASAPPSTTLGMNQQPQAATSREEQGFPWGAAKQQEHNNPLLPVSEESATRGRAVLPVTAKITSARAAGPGAAAQGIRSSTARAMGAARGLAALPPVGPGGGWRCSRSGRAAYPRGSFVVLMGLFEETLGSCPACKLAAMPCAAGLSRALLLQPLVTSGPSWGPAASWVLSSSWKNQILGNKAIKTSV